MSAGAVGAKDLEAMKSTTLHIEAQLNLACWDASFFGFTKDTYSEPGRPKSSYFVVKNDFSYKANHPAIRVCLKSQIEAGHRILTITEICTTILYNFSRYVTHSLNTNYDKAADDRFVVSCGWSFDYRHAFSVALGRCVETLQQIKGRRDARLNSATKTRTILALGLIFLSLFFGNWVITGTIALLYAAWQYRLNYSDAYALYHKENEILNNTLQGLLDVQSAGASITDLSTKEKAMMNSFKAKFAKEVGAYS